MPTETEIKSKLTDMAVDEVDSFKERHSRYPKEDEIEVISKNIFAQLKEDLKKQDNITDELQLDLPQEEDKKGGSERSLLEERKLRRNLRENQVKQPEKKEVPVQKKEEPKQAPKKEEEPEEIEELENTKSTASLFSDDLGEMNLDKIDENDESLKELASIDELSSLETDLEGEEDIDLIDKEIETPNSVCPTCKNKTEQLVYCPKCGTAFCNHCAKGILVQEQSVKYTCPKCGEEFKKRK